MEEGADVDAADESGNTALHFASFMGYPSKVIELLEAGANVNVKNEIGRTPLHEAVFMRELECVRALLEAGGKVDAVDNKGYTPIDFAYKANVEEIINVKEIIKELEKYANRNVFIIAGLYATSTKQLSKLENRIMKDGYELLDENKFIGEAELESLRYKAKKGRVDKIYLHSPGVLAKEFKDQVNLLRELWASGIEIVFISDRVQVSMTENLISFRRSYGW